MVNITFADDKKDAMSPKSPGSVNRQAGGSTLVEEGDMVKFKGDKDGHKFRVMRILEKCANVCCVEHTFVGRLEKIDD